jgi:flagellar motility protein MotE (MotC chaperone)
MMQFVRDFRLVPVVLLATIGLFTLKVFGLVFEGGYTLVVQRSDMAEGAADTRPASARGAAANERPTAAPSRRSWAQDRFTFADITGSVAEKKPEPGAEKSANAGKAEAGAPKPADPKPSPGGTPINLNNDRGSPAERAILEHLQERRQELEARGRELEIRENLLKATEQRIEARVGELKDMEARAGGVTQKKEEADAVRLKNLIIMYENMKAKDAAKIFDRLDLKILVDVATQINPRRMSDIMAQMAPEAAERLTVALATRAAGDKAAPNSELPKIEGRPNGS